MQLVFSEAGVTLRGKDGREVSGEALVVRPGASHALRPVSDVLLVFLEPQSAAAKRVGDRLGPGPMSSLPPSLAELVDVHAPFSACVSRLLGSGATAGRLDSRLQAALAFLATAEGIGSVGRAAAVVGLSHARLRALAQAQMGVPLSRWMAWRRLNRAGDALARGAGLAEAALAAGFADQAHLSRDMRKILGITPGAAQGVMGPQAKRPRP